MRMSYWSSDVCSSDLDQVLDQQIILSRHPAVGGPGDRPDREHDKAIASQPRPAIERDHHGRYRRRHGGDPLDGLYHRFLPRSEEHTSELQSLMRISYAVFCLKKKNTQITELRHNTETQHH